MALEIGALAGRIVTNRRASRVGIAVGAPLPPLSGYGLDFVTGPHSAPSSCAIYRFVSNRCPYCGEEESGWDRLRPLAGQAGCKIVILLPGLLYAPYRALRNPTPEVIWIPLDWAASVHLTVTPTTIIAYHGRIAWVWQGALGPTGVAELRSLLGRLVRGDGMR